MSVFPFISPETHTGDTLGTTMELPTFREYAYDYDHNRLKLKNGVTYLVEENEALKIWIFKALNTVRYRHIAYSRRYGCESVTLIGQTLELDILFSELRRFIIEALMVNPYIRELGGFTFSAEDAHVTVAFDCLTIYGTLPTAHAFERS